ncbi:M20/M25/M40 family metallo-hydrolase [Phenylobacterium sp.]|uniref:M20/M25/M40 family metallo-hydrolase n=1 Tax=Phenylobacterium sp. TaxID=1871053 RepID=UPI002C37BFEC|nr:M20/M25/M40 family metallo-hydrolase [Phenylobacterium sp.]HVI34238.1 M20/M25/M40 family metallo-hydrolase [Phenylobacterium sp.]
MGRVLALLAALVAATLIAWFDARPPAPEPATAPAAVFSAERAMADVAQIAREPHPMGTPANHRVRDHLLARMTTLGLSPQVRRGDAVTHRQRGGDTFVSGGAVENLVGVLPGRDRTLPAVALMAHYDSVPGSPGAADDAAGVAAALEIVRAIKAQGEPVRDVMVLITDGEESGLLGANAFFKRDPLARRVGLVVNMEARGISGRVQMFQTSAGNGELIDLLRRHAERPSSSSLSVFVYENMPNDTDMTESNEAGFPGMNFAFIGRQFDYHAATATPANMDRGTLQDLGAQVLAVTRAAAFAPTLPGKAPDAVYSQVFGDLVLAYPAWGGWIVLAVAGGLMLLGVVRARRIEAFPWPDVARGAGATISAVLGSAAILHFARRATGADFGYFEQRFLLAQVSRWEAAVFLLAMGFLLWSACELARGRRNIALVPLAAGLASSAFGGLDPLGAGLGVGAAVVAVLTYGRPAGRPGAWTGVLALTFLVAVAAQVAAPATGYMFAWPLALAGVGGAATAMAARRGLPAYALLALLAAIGLGWIAGTAHVLFLGLDMPELLAAAVWLAAILIWPLAQPEEGAPPARLVGPLLVAAGLVALVAVRLNDPWDARHPRATLVVYHLDQDTGRAWRVSTLERTPWVERVLTADGGRIAPSGHWAIGRPHIAAAARPLPAPTAQASLARQSDGSVLLTVVPPAGAREIGLRLRADTAVTLEQVASLPVKLILTPGRWTRVNWEAAPEGLTLRLRPAGPGTLDVRYIATIDGWPAGAAPLPPRPAADMPFDASDSVRVSGTRRFSW